MSIHRSYCPNYFSIEDILATQERIPCKFNYDVPRLGYLNPSSESDDINAGTKLELPMWLAENIALGRSTFANVELPRIYREAYREILRADANAVDLNKLNTYFYEFGRYVSKFDSRGDVSSILVDTFKTRLPRLIDESQNAGSNSSYINKFDILERSIYLKSFKASQELNNRLTKTEIPMEAAEMVINYKKRKLAEIDASS